jgi:hypothetical protein
MMPTGFAHLAVVDAPLARAQNLPGHSAQPEHHTGRTEHVMNSIWIGSRQTIEVPCSIEIEQTRDTLHAHVSLEGIEVEHGDEVRVHEAPAHIAFGERLVTSSRATVVRATPVQRFMTRMQAYLQLTELYEVGFQPKDEVKLITLKPDEANP